MCDQEMQWEASDRRKTWQKSDAPKVRNEERHRGGIREGAQTQPDRDGNLFQHYISKGNQGKVTISQGRREQRGK